MSAQSIEWHDECYRNRVAFHAVELNQCMKQLLKLQQDAVEINRYGKQIARAKKLRRKKFDRERFKDE